jgi:hypothetical protein
LKSSQKHYQNFNSHLRQQDLLMPQVILKCFSHSQRKSEKYSIPKGTYFHKIHII